MILAGECLLAACNLAWDLQWLYVHVQFVVPAIDCEYLQFANFNVDTIDSIGPAARANVLPKSLRKTSRIPEFQINEFVNSKFKTIYSVGPTARAGALLVSPCKISRIPEFQINEFVNFKFKTIDSVGPVD